MTLDEAKKLNPGDRVFIEARVEQDDSGRTIFAHGELFVSFNGGIGREKLMELVSPHGVRKEAK